MLKQGIMGIDIGGTGIKAGVFDENGQLLSFVSARTIHAYKSKKTGIGIHRSFVADELWKLTKSAISDAVLQVKDTCEIASIGISSLGCTVLLFDRDDCQIEAAPDPQLREQEYEKLKAALDAATFHARTGYPLEKELEGLSLICDAKIRCDIAKICTVDDYIVWKLTGALTKNYSTAASVGMWDTMNDDWLPFLKEESGLSDRVLGHPQNSGEFVGMVRESIAGELGLSTHVKVSTGGMDYQCAAFSVHELIGPRLLNVTGTFDLMALYGAWDARNISVRNMLDYHVIPDRCSVMVECAGAIQTEWLKNKVTGQSKHGDFVSWETFCEGLAEQYETQMCHREVFLPYVFGSLIPSADEDTTGVFGGLNCDTDPRMLLRTMLEGMAFQMKYVADYLSKGDCEKQIVAVGGGSRNRTWVQIKADVTGRDII
ncbi:MAG: FGGY-family carbohydrate kinase, partial [Lachnospiraceae bacterium]|nr:FGGY-family carbohydrate kinase [Lachnospiraceae bacterium]